MKQLLYIFIFSIGLCFSHAQDSITFQGKTLNVNTEANGELDLLWTITDGIYRYFARTASGEIYELKNTKDASNSYTNEYKTVLAELTGLKSEVLDKVKLTVSSLRSFFDDYNKTKNPNYNGEDFTSKVNFRLGFFTGVTNHPQVEFIENNTAFQFAAELELYGDTTNPRHSGLLQARQTFGSDGEYTSTEFSLGYRFRVIRKPGFNLYIQNRFASVNIFSVDRVILPNSMTSTATIVNQNETEFEVPFFFGVGADIKISDNSYISIIYDRFSALGLDSRGDFPADFTIGYKFNL